LALGATSAAWLGWRAAKAVKRRDAERLLQGARAVAASVRAAAEAEASAARRQSVLTAKDEALRQNTEVEGQLRLRESALALRREAVEAAGREVEAARKELAARGAKQSAGTAALAAKKDEVRGLERSRADNLRKAATVLEERAGATRVELRRAFVEAEIEAAHVEAAQRARTQEGPLSGTEEARRAKRLLGISVGRFSGHYLTERAHSLWPLPEGQPSELLLGPENRNLAVIEEVTHVRLSLSEDGSAIRLDGLDGVGRELARRTLAWAGRAVAVSRSAIEPALVERTAREIVKKLDHELFDLGRRAFRALEIPPAHAEIVRLVGRLNYRTSFTQNQWKHAVEAAFLCGMLASELRLDVKLARRAALLHDIGKALTHELDGSHAVIGADYARRLGEVEVVANAIGAHHTDEPFNSAYAYLVAAADAMSGARPGARRQTEDNFVSKVADLERLSRAFRGVADAFAVQGGREIRVYVNEEKVDDLGAVELSSAIAHEISEKMTFPGQIRVTVIRELLATEHAS
jgi:ribonuclease Y